MSQGSNKDFKRKSSGSTVKNRGKVNKINSNGTNSFDRRTFNPGSDKPKKEEFQEFQLGIGNVYSDFNYNAAIRQFRSNQYQSNPVNNND